MAKTIEQRSMSIEFIDDIMRGPRTGRKEDRRILRDGNRILQEMRVKGFRDGYLPASDLSKLKSTDRNLRGTNFRVRK